MKLKIFFFSSGNVEPLTRVRCRKPLPVPLTERRYRRWGKEERERGNLLTSPNLSVPVHYRLTNGLVEQDDGLLLPAPSLLNPKTRFPGWLHMQ